MVINNRLLLPLSRNFVVFLRPCLLLSMILLCFNLSDLLLFFATLTLSTKSCRVLQLDIVLCTLLFGSVLFVLKPLCCNALGRDFFDLLLLVVFSLPQLPGGPAERCA